MKIVMLSTNMARGGAETLVAQLSIRLRGRGHNVQVVSMIRPSAYIDELAAADVPLHAPALPRVPSLVRDLRPEVLHCHMFHANIAGRLLHIPLPIPVVISTLHSIAESKRNSDRIRARDLAYRSTNALCTRTLAVSNAVAERHRIAGAVRSALVIPNGVDTERFRPDAEARTRVRLELGISDDEFVWIAAGRLMWKKNYPALLKAFSECNRGTLLIAGEGPDEASLRAMAPKGTRFLGLRSDLPALLNAADAFVMTSVVEGLPLALLEAAATGLPCIATPAGGISETGVGIITEDVANAMKKVSSAPAAERSAMGDGARRQVLARYSLDVVTSQWEALYQSLM